MSMSMSMSPVAQWFKDLPISDPRCRNDSCVAFKAGHTASQAAVPYAYQFHYGWFTAYIYCTVIGLFALVHFYHMFLDRKPHRGNLSMFNKKKALVRMVSYRRISGQTGVYLGLPSFGVIFMVAMAFGVSCAMAFYKKPYYRRFRGYGSPPLAVRTGLMSAALIPLTVAFGGKVNVITFLTGYGHEKLNALHRWTGWIMFFLATVHTIPFFYQDSKDGILKQKFYAVNSLEFSGTPDYAFAFALVALSIPYIRRKAYELFVYTHLVFAIIFLGMSFWHFNQELDSWIYMWATLGIWLVQWIGRAFWKSSVMKVTEIWFEGFPTTAKKLQGGVVRLDVWVPGYWRWRPGQHAFLRWSQVGLLDNHPFTIASVPASERSRDAQQGNVMTFFVKAHTGSTKKLAAWLDKSPEEELRTFVDGPYGTVGRRYENCMEEVVLVAGGNGISAVLPYLEHLVVAMSKETTITKHVRLIWMVRSHTHIDWIADELQKILKDAPRGSVSIDIYVTDESLRSFRSESPKEKEMKGKEAEIEPVSSSSSGVDIQGAQKHFEGRPSLLRLIPEIVGRQRTAVIGCGPESLKIDLSNAIAGLQVRVLKGEAQEISLHTEAFDW